MGQNTPRDHGLYKSILINAMAEASNSTAGRFVKGNVVLDLINRDKKDPDRKRAYQCFYRLKGSKNPLVTLGEGRGQWALTEAGVRWSQSLKRMPAPAPAPAAPRPEHTGKATEASSLHVKHPAYEAVVRDIERNTLKLQSLEEKYRERVESLEEKLRILESKQAQLSHVELTNLTGKARIERLRQDAEIQKVQAAIRSIDLEIIKTGAEIAKTESEIAKMKSQAEATEAQIESMGGDTHLGGEEEESGEEDDEPALQARRQRSLRRAKGNQTNVWLTEHLSPTSEGEESELYKLLKASVAKKLSMSAATERVEDHVQQFLANLISRDGLAKKIDGGVKIRYSELCSWAVRSGYNDIRKDGKEPVCRALYGATTETERKRGGLWFGEIVDSDLSKRLISQGKSEDGASGTMTLMGNEVLIEDVHTPDESYDASELFQSSWTKIKNLFLDLRPKYADRYVRILGMAMEGYSTKEIAEVEKVTKNRVSALLQDARNVLKENREEFSYA